MVEGSAVSHYTNCESTFTAAFLYDIIIIERRVMTLAVIQAKKRPVIQKGTGEGQCITLHHTSLLSGP